MSANPMLRRYGFLLLPGFSLLNLGAATEVLRVANVHLGGRALEAMLLSCDGRAVSAAGGEVISVAGGLEAAATLAGLFIVAETLPERGEESILARLTPELARIERLQGVLGGLGTGAAWLAHAGMMEGFRCTLNSSEVARLAAACPSTIVSHFLFEIDRNRLSCGSGTACLDLLIQWLHLRHGERLTQKLTAHFGLERVRQPQERQALSSAGRFGTSAKLAEAVALMEANLGEPLTTEDIAGLVGVSRRQLERLFKQHLDTLPSRWYLEQRLARARHLLRQSSQSILQIALSCGFSSGAHFSNAYRHFFDRTPRDERSERAAAWRAAPAADAATSDSFPDSIETPI